MYIALAILLLAVLIVVHEAGHFMAARIMKIEVREFSVGFGPRLLGRKSKKTGTDFSLRLIPLGGFCAFYGEDDATGESKDDPRAFSKHNVWKRMFVILMGPVMNFVLAFVVAIVMVWCIGIEVPTEPLQYDPYISEVLEGPAAEAGIQAKDKVLEVNGQDMMDGTMETLLDTIGAWQEGDSPLHMKIQRKGETFFLDVTPKLNEETGKMQIGVMIGGRLRTEMKSVGFFEGFDQAWNECVYYGGSILRALWGLVKGEGWDQTGGPIAIVSGVSSQVEDEVSWGGSMAGTNIFTQLLIFISINLGLMNLLPIPGLDGSRLVFGFVEAIRRKPVPQEKEAVVHLIGMALLLLLMVGLTFKDIMGLFNR